MIKLNSWHYKLANYGNKRVWRGDNVNFCNYFRYVVYGTIHALFSLAFIALVSALTVGSLYDFYLWCVYDKPMNEAAIAIIAVLGSGITGLTIGYVIYKYLALTEDSRAEKRRLKRMESLYKEPSFFEMSYRKFKDKTCFLIEVEE